MQVNFFWKGGRFSFLHRLGIKSHIQVGHEPVVWLDGKPPVSPYSKWWVDDLEKVKIKDAREIFDVREILEKGGKIRAASDIWSWWFLYKKGGLFCDVDHIALKHFPDDEWILSSGGGEDQISVGLMKAPRGAKVFREAIKNKEIVWGNVDVFTKACQKYGITKTHVPEKFFPWQCNDWEVVLEDRSIPDSYSLHLYGKFIDRLNLYRRRKIETEYPESMLNKLVKRICD